jgi:hypothetical protein
MNRCEMRLLRNDRKVPFLERLEDDSCIYFCDAPAGRKVDGTWLCEAHADFWEKFNRYDEMGQMMPWSEIPWSETP